MGTIGILIAIALIVILAMKGFSIVFIAPLASIVVIVTNGMNFFPSLIGNETSFMTGLTGFLINFFGVFLLGAILAQYIEKSGAKTGNRREGTIHHRYRKTLFRINCHLCDQRNFNFRWH